jgi:hypothetical protein
MISRFTFRWAALSLVALLAVGCNLRVDKEKSNGKENVEIQTPLGDLKVRTNIDAKEVGLSVYPNARPAQKSQDDEHSANVNIDTPFFGLKVLAMGFESDDPPEKVVEFYKKDLARYGKVIECRGKGEEDHIKKNGGQEMSLKLECDENDPKSKDIELKAGEGDRQRVVGISPKGKGSEFGLVYIQIRGSERETM